MMMMLWAVGVAGFSSVVATRRRSLQGDHQDGIYYPEQVHLSLSGKLGEMVIDWVSSAPRGTAMVQHSSRPWQGKPLNAACTGLNQTGPPKCNPPNVPCSPGD